MYLTSDCTGPNTETVLGREHDRERMLHVALSLNLATVHDSEAMMTPRTAQIA
jgi:hypothetical protein